MKTKQEIFKPDYTEDEVNEVIEWFEKRIDHLPTSLRLDKATSTKDLPRTVQAYCKLLRSIQMKVAHSGYMAHLLLIREQLLEQGFE